MASNMVTDGYGFGIYLAYPYGNVIAHNVIEHMVYGGIDEYSGDGDTVTNNTVGDASLCGIMLSYSDENTIVNTRTAGTTRGKAITGATGCISMPMPTASSTCPMPSTAAPPRRLKTAPIPLRSSPWQAWSSARSTSCWRC